MSHHQTLLWCVADGESIESLLGSLKTNAPATAADAEDDVSIGVAKTLQVRPFARLSRQDATDRLALTLLAVW